MGRADRVAIIVAARSSSTRLLYKWKKVFGGAPVWCHVHNACINADVGPVIWAVPAGDPILQHMIDEQILVIAGDEDNVLDRMCIAARASGADHVIRITGDCPLMSPDLIRMMVKEHLDNDNDFTTNCLPPRYPDGLDVECVSVELLDTLLARSNHRPDYREHVTKEIYDRWGDYMVTHKLQAIHWTLPMGEKFSLDTEEDLERINAHVAGTC